MDIIKDGHTLNYLVSLFGLVYDKKFRYITDSGTIENNVSSRRALQSEGFDLRYFDGCFFPFITRRAQC